MATQRRMSFYKKLKDAYVDASNSEDRDLESVLAEVVEFVKAGSFVSSGTYQDFHKAVYLEADVAAEMLGVTEGALRVREKSMSDKLYTIFGADFFTMIYAEGGVEEAKRRVSLVGLNSKEVLTSHINRLIGSSTSVGSYEIVDAAREVLFLQNHVVGNIKRDFEALDKDKLVYIINVLNGDAGTTSERSDLAYRLGILDN